MDSKRFAQYTFVYVVLASLAATFFIANPYIVYAVVYLPPIIVLFIKRHPIRTTLSLQPVSSLQLLFTAAIAICITVASIIINNLFNFPPSRINLLNQSLEGFVVWPNILLWLLSAVLIGLVYRGIIQNGFQELSPIRLCLVISLLFALSRSVFDIPALILIGFVYSLLAYETGSVIPAIIAQFLLSFLREPLSNLIYNIGLMWGNLFTLIFLLLAALGVMILLFRKMHGRHITVNYKAEAIEPAQNTISIGKKSVADILFIVAIVVTVLLTLWKTYLDIFFMLNH